MLRRRPRIVIRRSKLETAVLTARALFRTSRGIVRFSWRHRRPLAPVHAAITLGTLGAACGAAADGWKTALLLDASLAAGTAWWLRRRRLKDRPLRPREHAYALTSAGTAGALLLAMAARGGIAPPMPGLLLIWLLAVGIPWWWHHRIRDVDGALGEEIELWEQRVAHDRGALTGSWLTNLVGRQDGNGVSALINLPPGELTTEQAVAATGRIASAFGVPPSSVVIEATAEGANNQAELAVYKRNPLQAVHPWPGPHLLDHEAGVAPIGVYPDGGHALYRFWRPGSGPVHDLIAGTTDAGKSRLLDQLLAYERHSPLMVSWVIDPQRGQSLPDWQDAVDWFADSVAEGKKLLKAAQREMYRRNKLLARMEWTDEKGRLRRGKASFTPTKELPLLCLTIEEAHAVLADPQNVKIVEDLAKMARKCGIKLRLVTQVPLLAQLGNSMTLRDMVAAGNVVVLRTANRLSGQVAFNGTIPADPHALPREFPDGSSSSGLGYSLGPQARSSVMRTHFVEDPFEWATTGETTALCADGIATAGTDYATWRQRRDEAWGTPERADEPAAVSLAKDAAAADADVDELAPVVPADDSAKSAICTYLAERDQARTGVIAHDLDIPLPTVSQSLRRLAAEGRVRRVRHGVWAAVNTDAAERDDAAA
ncbi:hypothetical protein K378_04095 [Streptomyces sp. Amel2xB2]|uniref:helix-turn-helix domain-containing protein n=1 Tax=Streptomyces sp. Amel2xB2 TaxID=1305829 RepID=UPI000DB91786|nr:helix-turn-helix domain-containing protein [Streptomyces sp. Amel2xB2]RAJ61735.1 hypothetical protein K378_04095 [Streptomyces sp. Amel2xB2]